MARDIQDFVSIHVYKTGKVLYWITPINEANICRWLRDQGFGKGKVDNKMRYMRRTNSGIQYCNFYDLKNVFKEYLRDGSFDNLPQGVENIELVEWFYRTNPIKRNGIFNAYLAKSEF